MPVETKTKQIWMIDEIHNKTDGVINKLEEEIKFLENSIKIHKKGSSTLKKHKDPELKLIDEQFQKIINNHTKLVEEREAALTKSKKSYSTLIDLLNKKDGEITSQEFADIIALILELDYDAYVDGVRINNELEKEAQENNYGEGQPTT